MTSQSFCFPSKVPSWALPTPTSQTSQMEERQAEPDTLPSARYGSPTFSLPWSQQTAKQNSPITEPEHPFAPVFPTPHPPADPPCPPAPSATAVGAPSHPHGFISGEPEMLGDVLKSKLTSLATHGCCGTAGEAGKHLCSPLRGDANSLRVRPGGSAGSEKCLYQNKHISDLFISQPRVSQNHPKLPPRSPRGDVTWFAKEDEPHSSISAPPHGVKPDFFKTIVLFFYPHPVGETLHL